MNQQELIERGQALALEMYEQGGDMLVECWAATTWVEIAQEYPTIIEFLKHIQEVIDSNY